MGLNFLGLCLRGPHKSQYPCQYPLIVEKYVDGNPYSDVTPTLTL